MKHLLLLLLAAIIWGFAFVAQKVGMEFIGPFAFNGIRFTLGAISLLPLLFFQKQLFGTSTNQTDIRFTVRGGIILGGVLFVAASLQQVGIIKSTAGNAGFITSLYIVIVPFLGIFLKHKITIEVWVGAMLAVVGLYFLSINQQFQMAPGDGLVLISAFFWALHIILIGYYAPKTNVLLLSVIQFAVSALLNLVVAFIFEEVRWTMISNALYPILYGGILSIGVAYTLQVVGQRNVAPSKAAIVLSLEAVFAVLGGWLLLSETLPFRKGMGALIMLIGLIISQLKFTKSVSN
ncbi:MAG: EamA family transporter [Bacteroidetes bacterium]|nr:MAG: EamA family transporter [Bacteroidota bacterium]